MKNRKPAALWIATDRILTDGDPLAIPTQVRDPFIKGALTSTDNKQLRLYEEYSKRS